MRISKILFLLIFFAVSYQSSAIDTLKLDTEKSYIKWKSGSAIEDFTGTINFNSGMAITYGSRFSAGSFVINMESITVDIADNPQKKREILDIITSSDMFDVENHNNATFIVKSSDPVYSKSDTSNNNRISGKLTIKGVSQTIAMVGRLKISDTDNSFRSTATIDRTKFEMKYKSGSFFEDLGDELIKDKIELEIVLYFN